MTKLILLFIIIFSQAPSFAQQFPETMLILSKDKTTVVFVGPLPEGKQIVNIIKDLPQSVTAIQLESDGGRLDIALEIATEIKKRKLLTFTKTKCISACTFMFVSGKKRLLDQQAYIVFHQIKYFDPKLSEQEKSLLKSYWQGRATQHYISSGLDLALSYEIERNKEIVKFGHELSNLGYATSIKDYSLENFPPQFEVSEGTVIYPKNYVDPAL